VVLPLLVVPHETILVSGLVTMSTGWKYLLSDGRTFKNQRDVKEAVRQNPALTVTFSELSMAGTKLTDVTDKFRSVDDREVS
jgi:hypothetical protein